MDKYRLLNEIARKHSAVLLPNMSVSTLLAAFEIQKSLPIYHYEYDYQFDNIWMESVFPLAKAEAKRMARSIMCDCDLVVELARRIYKDRSRYWTDPGYVICNHIRFWQVFEEVEDLTERDDYMAFDFLLEHTRQHQEIFSGISFRNNNIAGSKETIVQSIFTAMEEKYDDDIPAYRLNAMKAVIQNVVTRMLEFMITNRDGVTFGDIRDYDYVVACLGNMNIGPQHHEVCKQIIMGYSEQPDWIDIIEAMLEEKVIVNPYAETEEENY
ncbi:hypothetical protein [Vibrio phage vB_VmeM-Yong XC32]|nr:hypothetical protein [Vibrio phage vB_VmeM-Yong XC31]QAX96336.1 hypothetical protein [Vibrio phage vB_VmeM-Yong XC32]QAX96654.1 hypothetical protein [Vibrio phage vB_VmeM-Yong MS31]QAX96972.1 hypothetical protein [Vibrio phage vB_VmeM-Yong MS32]